MGYKVDKYLGTIREDDAAIATSAASQAVAAASQAVSAMNKVMEEVNLIHLGPCSALGIVWTENGAKINWTDPEDVSLNDSVLAEWNKTVLIRKIGSYPTSPTDGVLVAQTSRAAANKNYYRDHLVEDSTPAFVLTQDETFQSDKTYWHVVNGVMVAGVVNTDYAIGDAIPANTWYDDNENVYYYMLFSETTGEAVTVSDANKYPVYTEMSWAMLKMFVRAGTAQNYTNLGDLFEVDHLEYTLECRLEGYDTSEPQDETLTHSIRLGVENILFQSSFDGLPVFFLLFQQLFLRILFRVRRSLEIILLHQIKNAQNHDQNQNNDGHDNPSSLDHLMCFHFHPILQTQWRSSRRLS